MATVDRALLEEDSGLGADMLRDKYIESREYPSFPKSDWQLEVANDDTERGYWDWVAAKIEDAAWAMRHAAPGPI